MLQVQGVVVRADGTETWTPWFSDGDPAVIAALRKILNEERPRGYLVVWNTRELEASAVVEPAGFKAGNS